MTGWKICILNDSFGPVYTAPEKFENAALFLWLDQPSTLICHENGALRKTLFNPGELKNAGVAF